MIDSRRLELLHAEIDGELDAHGRAELARALLADPETRALRDDLRRLTGRLDAIGQVEPPAELVGSVLRSLPPANSTPARSHRPAGHGAGYWRYAAMLAGAIVAGTLVFRFTNGQLAPDTEVSGTLAAQRTTETLDSTSISGGTKGRASLVRDASGLQLAIELTSGTPVDLKIASGEHSLTINGLGAGRTVLGLPGFSDQGQPLKLTFSVNGREVGRAELAGKAAR
jgi:hypothetical protein